MTHHALNHATAGIAFSSDRFDALDHRSGHVLIRTTHDVALDGIKVDRQRINAGFDGVDAFDPGQHLGAASFAQQLFGDGPSGDTSDGLPG